MNSNPNVRQCVSAHLMPLVRLAGWNFLRNCEKLLLFGILAVPREEIPPGDGLRGLFCAYIPFLKWKFSALSHSSSLVVNAACLHTSALQ